MRFLAARFRLLREKVGQEKPGSLRGGLDEIGGERIHLPVNGSEEFAPCVAYKSLSSLTYDTISVI